MMISHLEHLVKKEGLLWGRDAAFRGAAERLVPILMTAVVTALGLSPLALCSGASGREIEGPMAVVILGGLVTSTVLTCSYFLPWLCVMEVLYRSMVPVNDRPIVGEQTTNLLGFPVWGARFVPSQVWIPEVCHLRFNWKRDRYSRPLRPASSSCTRTAASSPKSRSLSMNLASDFRFTRTNWLAGSGATTARTMSAFTRSRAASAACFSTILLSEAAARQVKGSNREGAFDYRSSARATVGA